MTNLPKHSRLTLALTLFLPAYFMVAALGTRIGLWDWKFGLGVLVIGGAMIVLGVVALAALVSLVLALRAKPRRSVPVAIAIIGLLVPAAALAMLGGMRGKAAENPIHDIATDTADPPAFSAETMAAREAAGANPLSDYQTPLGQLPLYAERAPDELKGRSHAQIITARADRPAPLPLGGASRAEGVAAVAAAMAAMGLDPVRTDESAGLVEGVATSFWFGFKDDVAARVSDAEIDFRSASRVGISDLGANTARINELRQRTETLLGPARR